MKFGTALMLLLSSFTSAAYDADSTKPNLRSEAFFETIDDEIDDHPDSRRLAMANCTDAPTTLFGDDQLMEGEYLCAGSYRFGLVKGKLYIFHEDRFAPMTQLSWVPTRGYRVKMQLDGNLVMRDDSDKALWDSMTNSVNSGEDDNVYAILDPYGTLIIRRVNGSPTYFAAYPPGCLYDWSARPRTYLTTLQSDQRLFPGQYLCDNRGLGGENRYFPGRWRNNGYGFGMDVDGELFVADGDGEGKAAGTAGVGWYAVMQNDGNLVVYDTNGMAVWPTNTAGFAGATLDFTNGIATIVDNSTNMTEIENVNDLLTMNYTFVC